MATVRRKSGNFHTISRALSQNETLSAEAVGVMAYLLSKPDDWIAQLSDIERRFKIGRDKRRRIIRELENEGYLERIETRFDGKFDYQILVHETALPVAKRTKETTRTNDEVNPLAVEPSAAEPLTEKPSTVNPSTYMIRDIQKTDLQKKEKTSAADAAPHQVLMDYLATKIGTYSDGKIQGKSVKWLLDHSYTVEQCKGCLDFLLSETWRTNRVSWQTVEKEIGNWLRRNPKLKISAEAEKAWQAMLDDLRAGLGCSDCETVSGKGNYPFGRGYVAFPYGDRQYPCKTCNPKLETHPKHELYLQMLELQSGGSVNGSVQR